jgi:hypothetical protein
VQLWLSAGEAEGARRVTTFTIATNGPYRKGQTVYVAAELTRSTIQATILRVSPHELLVRVGGKPLAFQEHEPGVWSWCQPEQTSFELGDERQGRLV